MSVTLEKRPAKIGTSINTRRELHGEEPVPAMDIPIVGVLLEREELNDLLGEAHAWDCLFDSPKGKSAMPIFAKTLKPLGMTAKFKDCRVTLWLGLKLTMVDLTGVKLTKLKLEPQGGGLTALSLTVQALCESDVSLLLQYLDSQVDVAVDFGDAEDESDEEQAQLDLTSQVGSTTVQHEKVDTAKRKRKSKISDGATLN